VTVVPDSESSDSEERKGSEEVTRRGKVTSMMVTDKIIDILVLLEKKTSAMEKRIEKIEAGINELCKKKKSEGTEKREATRGVEVEELKQASGGSVPDTGIQAQQASSTHQCEI
jgi:hypothetical protein